MEIISLEEGKIKFTDNLVFKKSSESEFKTMKKACELTRNLLNVYVPQLYSFENNIICMERCFGDNLELLLRNDRTHNLGVQHLNYLLQYFMSNNFYWKDFAPRNILVNDKNYIIVDFERGLSESNINEKLYLIDSVYEEYSAFLLPNERIISVDEVFDIPLERNIKLSSIKSKRVCEVLSLLGYSDNVPFFIYLLAIKMIVLNEEPYIEDDNIIYPLVELENYIKTFGRRKYAEKIIGGYYERIKKI